MKQARAHLDKYGKRGRERGKTQMYRDAQKGIFTKRGKNGETKQW